MICSECNGTGAREHVPTPPFKGRVRREGIRTVATRSHGIVIEPGIDLGEVSYEDFLAGKMPTDDATLYERYTGKQEQDY